MSEGDSMEPLEHSNLHTSSSLDSRWRQEAHEDSGLASSFEETVVIQSETGKNVKVKTKRRTKKRCKNFEMSSDLIFDLDIWLIKMVHALNMRNIISQGIFNLPNPPAPCSYQYNICVTWPLVGDFILKFWCFKFVLEFIFIKIVSILENHCKEILFWIYSSLFFHYGFFL